MADRQGQPELLELLAYRAGCDCISDLHTAEGYVRLRGVSEELAPERWPLEEWSDAYHYITGKAAAFSAPEQAQRALEAFLQGE